MISAFYLLLWLDIFFRMLDWFSLLRCLSKINWTELFHDVAGIKIEFCMVKLAEQFSKAWTKFNRKNFDAGGLGTHLFVKVPWPGDSERTFAIIDLSCHLLLTV